MNRKLLFLTVLAGLSLAMFSTWPKNVQALDTTASIVFVDASPVPHNTNSGTGRMQAAATQDFQPLPKYPATGEAPTPILTIIGGQLLIIVLLLGSQRREVHHAKNA